MIDEHIFQLMFENGFNDFTGYNWKSESSVNFDFNNGKEDEERESIEITYYPKFQYSKYYIRYYENNEQVWTSSDTLDLWHMYQQLSDLFKANTLQKIFKENKNYINKKLPKYK